MAGVTLNDRKLAAEVRTLSLHKVKSVLSKEPETAEAKRFQEQLLLRLATTLLPRLNEHTGDSGEPLFTDEHKDKAKAAIAGALGRGNTGQGG